MAPWGARSSIQSPWVPLVEHLDLLLSLMFSLVWPGLLPALASRRPPSLGGRKAVKGDVVSVPADVAADDDIASEDGARGHLVVD